MALSRLLPCPQPALFPHSQMHVLNITRQTSLPRGAADMCAVGHTDMSAASHCRHACCDTQQTCLLCDTAHLCCVAQQPCLRCNTTDMSAA